MSDKTIESEQEKLLEKIEGKIQDVRKNEGYSNLRASSIIEGCRFCKTLIQTHFAKSERTSEANGEVSPLEGIVSGTGGGDKGYKVFDMDYFDIALDDMPGKDKLVICRDPQNRLNEGNWAVVKQNDERGEKPPTAIALFWELAEAETFAQKY